MIVPPALVVFHGGMHGSPVEDALAAVRRAATFDTIDTARAADIERVILLTDDPELQAADGVEVVVDTGHHEFGRALAIIVEERRLRSVIYIGGGSVPLLDAAGFREIEERLQMSMAVTNNRYSSDLVAWNPDAAGMNVVRAVARDNSFARALQESGVSVWEMPRTLQTVLDIDSPCDVAVFAITGLGGPRLRDAVGETDLDLGPYRRVLRHFVTRTSQLVVAGRVGTHVWQYLERETACRVRVFAEERGMEADGRAESGDVRSLVGYFIEANGCERFFGILSELGDAAIIDTRVLLAHNRVNAGRTDRFLSDARRPGDIAEPFLREFTQAAVEARIPVLIGGHALVSGGLMALSEYAWQQNDAGLLVND